jgi:hypothetical protein
MEEPHLQKKDSNGIGVGVTGFVNVLKVVWGPEKHQPRSGERMQPTAQAVGSLNQEVELAPEGANEELLRRPPNEPSQT